MSGGGNRAILTAMEAGTHSARKNSFLVPCVLLILREDRREAGELRELLAAFGFHRQVATLEATLDRLEADLLVRSVPRAHPDGSTRRHFQLTVGGEQWLAARSGVFAEPARLLARFLDGYASLAPPVPRDEG